MSQSIRTTDVLVIGGGLAGMQAALHVTDRRVTLVNGGTLGESGASPRAKGGIAAPMSAEDHPSLHARDTVAAGAKLCHPGAVHLATERGSARLREVFALGVDVDRQEAGELALGHEAAHSRRRIVRAGGDRTGAAVCAGMVRCLRHAAHIATIERAHAVDLIIDSGRVAGAIIARDDGHLEAILAHATVLATGGVGQLYERTSNPPEALASGLALALRAGATLADLEFVQFHPTALAVDANPLPLLTEALRGEGAVLVDEAGARFMPDIHPRAELAPRDVVSRAIWRRLQDGGEVFLDATDLGGSASGNGLAERFPGAVADCRSAGLDPSRDLLPVTPVAHYHMGGVAVDLEGRSSMRGLWACGEVAHTGLHGANRLASNSLLEALVFGARVGRSVSRTLSTHREELHVARGFDVIDNAAPPHAHRVDQGVLAQVRRVMWREVGLLRSEAGLRRALSALDALAANVEPRTATDDLVSLASLMTLAALRRRESRGAHHRLDAPETLARWRRRQLFTPFGLVDEPVDATRDFCWQRPLSRRLPF
jgi:L-aspartate oxidase